MKKPPLVHINLDARLRLSKVVTSAFLGDSSNDVLRILADQPPKNRANWIVVLRTETSDILQQWVVEREYYEKYEDTD